MTSDCSDVNEKANLVVKIPFGETDPFSFVNTVRQGTVMGSIMLPWTTFVRRVTSPFIIC